MNRFFLAAILFFATSTVLFSCKSTQNIQIEESSDNATKSSFILLEPERHEEIAAGRTKVTFKTDVPKITVYINNEFHGLTPLEIHNLIPGKYFATLKREGYKTVQIAIQIKDGISDYYYIEMEVDDSEQ